MTRTLLVGLGILASACAAPPVAEEYVAEGSVVLARFGDARALATDGIGRLYVVDAAAAEVVILDTTGTVIDRLGGTEEQAFLDVADVDPTNGQAVFVADAGTGQIVRFTAEGRPAEAIPVPRLEDVTDPGRAGDGVGRPVAVAAGPGNVLYTIEVERGVVLRLDADRQLDRILGGPTSPVPLLSPTALAVSGTGWLLVADGDRVVVFDAFGAVVDTVSLNAVERVSVAEGVELAITRTGVRELASGGDLAFDLGEPLVDAAVAGPDVLLLTRTRLIRMPFAGF